MTDILKEIVSNHGYVTEAQLEILAVQHPILPLVVKWNYAPRGIYPANEIKAKIEQVEKYNPNEYVREVFLSANQLDTIRETINN